MEKTWIKTMEYGYFIDHNSVTGVSYQKISRAQCPHCKEKYPTVPYIMDANYCPNCGENINIK